MWYSGQHPGNQYILEETIAVSSGPGGFWPVAMTPVCANCAQAPVQHQYVLDEIATYDQPGMAGLGALAGRAFKVFRAHARRLKAQPQGRVFMPQAASGAQQVQDAQFAPQDAQEVAAQELAVSQPRAKRFLVEPEGIARMRAEGAQIFGGGTGIRRPSKPQRPKAPPAGGWGGAITPESMRESMREAAEYARRIAAGERLMPDGSWLPPAAKVPTGLPVRRPMKPLSPMPTRPPEPPSLEFDDVNIGLRRPFNVRPMTRVIEDEL